MDIATAQQDVRRIFRGGFIGQLVSALVWLASAVAAMWSLPRSTAGGTAWCSWRSRFLP